MKIKVDGVVCSLCYYSRRDIPDCLGPLVLIVGVPLLLSELSPLAFPGLDGFAGFPSGYDKMNARYTHKGIGLVKRE